MATLHLYLTDGHEWAGWNTAGTTHRVTVMRHGQADDSTDFHSLDDAKRHIAAAREDAARASVGMTVHDLTGRG